MPATTSADWDAFASRYDTNFTRCTTPHAVDMLSAVLPQIRAARTVVDIGCGPGAFGHAYMSRFPRGIPGQTLILTDISPGMLEIAKRSMEHAAGDKFRTKLEFRVEDATSMDGFDTDSVDVVVSCFAVFLIEDNARVFSTIRRILRPGGVFATTAWTAVPASEQLAEAGFGDSAHQVIGPIISDLTPRSPDAAPPKWVAWNAPATIREMLDVAGLCDVRVHRAVHSVAFENPQEVWDIATNTSPMGYTGGADEEAVEQAKKTLWQKLAPINGAIFLSMASNIVVAYN